MSPEQIAAKPLDARSDVFSLAIVLWEMLAMRRLFAAETEVETIRLVQNASVPLLRQVNPEIDSELEAIVDRGLAKDLKRRYSSAGAFEKDLMRYLHSRFPDFTSGELGNFLKITLAKKRTESQEDIKKVLTSSDLKIATRAPETMPPIPMTTGSKGERSQNNRPTINGSNALDTSLQIAIPVALANKKAASIYDNAPKSSTAGRPMPNRSAHQTLTAVPGLTKGNLQKRQQSKYPSRLKLFTVAGVLLVAMGATFTLRSLFLATPTVHLKVETEPADVKFNLDGKALFDGEYRHTPLNILTTPGAHHLRLIRDGYDIQQFDFQGSANQVVQLDSVVLKPRSESAFSPVRILVEPENKKTAIDINNGFYSGTAPIVLNDLPYNKQAFIEAYPNFPQKNDTVKCSFTPRATNYRSPTVIVINVTGRNDAPHCLIRNP